MQSKSLLDMFILKMSPNSAFLPDEYNDVMYHYTSSSGFDSILFNNKNVINFWASRYNCLNDYSEGKIVLPVYTQACEELLQDGLITKEVYELVIGIKQANTHLLHLSKNGTVKFKRYECDRYICSFSKNRDSLSMWNYYSKDNKYEGYNIGIDSKNTKDILVKYFSDKLVNVAIYPVVYNREEQKKYIKKMLLQINKNYSKEHETSIRCFVSTLLLEWNLLFKSDYFQHEEEVRIIIDVAKLLSVTKEKADFYSNIRYRKNYGLIIPYIEIEIGKDSLISTTIGPLRFDDSQKELQKQIMNEQLIKNGYGIIDIAFSKIPIRY